MVFIHFGLRLLFVVKGIFVDGFFNNVVEMKI